MMNQLVLKPWNSEVRYFLFLNPRFLCDSLLFVFWFYRSYEISSLHPHLHPLPFYPLLRKRGSLLNTEYSPENQVRLISLSDGHNTFLLIKDNSWVLKQFLPLTPSEIFWWQKWFLHSHPVTLILKQRKQLRDMKFWVRRVGMMDE